MPFFTTRFRMEKNLLCICQRLQLLCNGLHGRLMICAFREIGLVENSALCQVAL